jgi:hypothetical protein
VRYPTDSGPVPGWHDEDLAATAQQNLGAGADAGLPAEVRFRAGVTRVVRRWMGRAKPNKHTTPAVFFLCPRPPAAVDVAELVFVPMLDNGLTDVDGHLWFVGPVAAQGRGLALTEWSDESIFAFATNVLAVGDVPAVLVETRTDSLEARYYPRGLANPDEYELLRLRAAMITLDDICRTIGALHANQLVTPEGHYEFGKLWLKPQAHWPQRTVERRIQMYVHSALQGYFNNCVVRAEQDETTGRLDLEIEEQDLDDPSTVVRHALLELKVLKSFGSSGRKYSAKEAKDWIREGVVQAAAYRESRKARLAVLCCFDMRVDVEEESTFRGVKTLASRRKVALRAWALFPSAKAYQRHLSRQTLTAEAS